MAQLVETISLSLLFFGGAAERLGEARRPVTIEKMAALSEAAMKQLLAQRFQDLAPLMPGLRLAHNEAFWDGQIQLNDGDRIALLPPVCGG